MEVILYLVVLGVGAVAGFLLARWLERSEFEPPAGWFAGRESEFDEDEGMEDPAIVKRLGAYTARPRHDDAA